MTPDPDSSMRAADGMDPAAAQAAPPGGGSLAVRLLGFLVAAVLLWVVALNVPWQDQLLLRTGPDAEPVTIEGSIDDAWRDSAVRFLVEPNTVVEGTLPEPLAELAAQGGGLAAAATSVRLDEGGQLLAFEHVEWRPGILRLFGELDLSAILIGLGWFLVCCVLLVTRWWRLLKLAGCATTWLSVWRVHFVGMFFNVIIPGISGGDVARAYLIVKGHPERRANALMTVMVDRVIGLLGMGILSAIAVNLSDERFSQLRIPVTAAAALMIGACLAFGSPWWRRLLRIDSWLHRLPQGERLVKLDQAARQYFRHPLELAIALVLSIGNHLGACAVAYSLGHAMGDTHAYLDYVCVTTVVNTLTAVPLSPGGLGVGEFLYGTLFVMAGGNYALGVAVSVTYRLCLMLLGLLGGVLLLAPGGRDVRADYQRAAHAALE